ncbi:hypothetical protein IV203_004144 [Nitzschia inconspicua]|uniref:Uncharacterized protein n=1 Tax=Nitzschia inconspicua TaxID=303405 RepID=A0A9K3L318_9STRA|nr:hypothetical protein IV203_004144 [Nitzschia inconspicua]
MIKTRSKDKKRKVESMRKRTKDSTDESAQEPTSEDENSSEDKQNKGDANKVTRRTDIEGGESDEVAAAQKQAHYTIFCLLFMLGFMIHCRKYPDENYSLVAMVHIVSFISVPSATTTIYQDATFLSFCCFCLFTMLQDSPYNANHHNMCGFLSMLLIPHQIRRVVGWGDKQQSTDNGMNVVRWAIILMYFFAAFHKINHDFLFEPKVSCAYHMLRLYLDFIDEDMFDEEEWLIPEKLPWFLEPLPFMGLFVEIVPPIAMCFQSTQKWGVFLLIFLHLLLLPVGFADFGSIAQSFLWLFVMPQATKALPMTFYTDMAGCFVFLHLIVKLLNHMDEKDEHHMQNEEVAMVLLGYGVHWAGILRIGGLREGVKMRRPKSVFSLLALAFFVFFTMNTYLGLRTTGTLTMFSNLRTEGKYSNHLLLRNNPFKVFGYQDDVVTVLDRDERISEDRLLKDFSYANVNFQREMLKEKSWDEDNVYLKVSYQGEIYETNDLNNDPIFDIFRQEEPFWSRKYLHFRDIQPYRQQDCEW